MHEKLTLAPMTRAPRLLWAAALVLLLAALLFGGATREGFLAHAALRVGALGVLLLAVWRAPTLWRAQTRWPLLLLGAAFAVPLLQLIPLPPGLWTVLPGREPFAEAYRAAGMALPWAPISLAPHATLNAALSLLPPAAMFVATLAMDTAQRRAVLPWVLAVAAASFLLGLGQVAGGAGSELRLYEITNPSEAVGFFANRNHQASFLIVALPLAAFWALAWAQRGQQWLLTQVGIGLAVLFAAGVGTSNSRAGVLLLAVAGVGCLFMVMRAGRLRYNRRNLIILGLLLAAALVPALVFGLGQIVQTLPQAIALDPRSRISPVVFDAAIRTLPFGTGLGAFDPIYRMLETPQTLTNAFMNHAHNDYLELMLETGLAAPVLIVLFFAWFGRTAVAGWRGAPMSHTAGLARAATVAILMLLAHSAVDYPLRTPALATLFAFLCGCMIAPERGRHAHRDGKEAAASVELAPAGNRDASSSKVRP